MRSRDAPALCSLCGIKGKQESKKTRKHAFDQENYQEKQRKERKHALDQESDQEKKEKTFFIS